MAENEDYGYLQIKSEDKNVLANLTQMGEKLKALKANVLAAEEQLTQAKKEYDHYANVVLAQEMASTGIDSISLQSGGRLSLKHNFYCQPNKNAEDRARIVAWLRANGGEHLVDIEGKVDSSSIESLKKTGIPFVEQTAVNTTKMKTFLKDWIGATSGKAQGSIEDIPACIHFSEVTTVELTV